MSTLQALIIADFQTQLATSIAVAGTTATLQSATDDDGVALPSGRYFFTIDGSNSSKEHISCDLSGTSLTNIKSVSRQGTETAGVARAHRIGATVTITDFAHILQINNLLKGTTNLNASTPLGYDGAPSITTGNQLATKTYVDGIAIAGSPDATTTTKGISKMSVAPVSATSPIAVGQNDPKFVDYFEETGAANAYVLTPSPSIGAYADGQHFSFRAANGNTTTSTLNVNGLGAKVIYKETGTVVLASGDIATGMNVEVIYENVTDSFRMQTPVGNAPLTSLLQTFNYPLGESFTGATTPQPATLISDIEQLLFDGTSSYGAAASPQVACKIIPRQNLTITTIIGQFNKGTDPGTNLTIEIQTDSSGLPSNTPITNGTSVAVASTSITTTAANFINFTFSTPPTLVAGTTYHIVFKTSATNANQLIVPSLTNAKKYASFSGSSYNGTTWTANQPIPYFEIITATGGSKSLWIADGNGTEPLEDFMGFVTTTGSAGATGTFIKYGQLGGFSGLAIGAEYYLSNTIGTLTLNKNEGVYVGTALSATTLDIPLTKIGAKETLYTGVFQTGVGGAWESYIYTFNKDGYFYADINISGTNNTKGSCHLYVGNTYANGTLSGNSVGTLSSDPAGVVNRGTLTIPVKKGDRIEIVTDAIAGPPGITLSFNSVYFTPNI